MSSHEARAEVPSNKSTAQFLGASSTKTGSAFSSSRPEHGTGGSAGEVADSDAQRVYERLKAVGMPDGVSFDAFLRLYGAGGVGEMDVIAVKGKGKEKEMERDKMADKSTRRRRTKLDASVQESPALKHEKWKDALDVLSSQLVGRAEVLRVREVVVRARKEAEGLRTRIKAPSVHSGLVARDADVLEDPMRVAEARRESAHRVLGAVRREWEVESEKVGVLDRKMGQLRREVDEKRRVLLMLNILEKREGYRMARIGDGDGTGIGNLLKDLKKESALAIQQVDDVLERIQRAEPSGSLPHSSSVSIKLKSRNRRPGSNDEHTTNALANLYAYHARLRTDAVYPKVRTDEIDSRLEDALRKLGVDVEVTKNQLVAVSKQRATARLKFRMPSESKRPMTEKDLEEMQRANRMKKRDVQSRLDNAVGLGWVCEGYIDLISTFQTETASALCEMLETERKRIEGYVDNIKADIVRKNDIDKGGFATEVRQIMGSQKVRVWEDAEDALKFASKMGAIQSSTETAVDGNEEPRMSSFRMDVDRNEKLLERKGKKAEHGYDIADEIRKLLDDGRKLKYI